MAEQAQQTPGPKCNGTWPKSVQRGCGVEDKTAGATVRHVHVHMCVCVHVVYTHASWDNRIHYRTLRLASSLDLNSCQIADSAAHPEHHGGVATNQNEGSVTRVQKHIS